MNKQSTSSSASCPNCGFPMQPYCRFCFHCKKFVDLRQNRLLLPGEVPDQELDELLQTVEKARAAYESSDAKRAKKRAKGIMIAGIVLICTLFFAAFGIFLVMISLIMQNHGKKKPPQMLSQDSLEEVMASYLVPTILQKAFDRVDEYGHLQCVSIQEVQKASLMQEVYNEVTGSDYVRAVYRGLPVELCDLQLNYTQKNSAGMLNRKPVFQGTFLICRLGIHLPEQVTIWERQGHAPMGPGLGTGNPVFDQNFYVESRHPQTAAALLTPQLVQDIMQLDFLGNGCTTLKFMEDGTLYVAIAAPYDRFEVRQSGENTALLRQRFTNELNHVMQLIHLIATVTAREWYRLNGK